MGFSFAYKVVLFLHLGCAIVGFGSSFVYPVLAAKARKLSPPEAYAINSSVLSTGTYVTSYPIYATGAFGVLLILLSDKAWTFSQAWISIAFVIFFVSVAIAVFLHSPNLKAMVALQEKLASGNATPTEGGPPAEVLELQERGPKAQLYGGILHVMFLLMLLDMVFKPGIVS